MSWMLRYIADWMDNYNNVWADIAFYIFAIFIEHNIHLIHNDLLYLTIKMSNFLEWEKIMTIVSTYKGRKKIILSFGVFLGQGFST